MPEEAIETFVAIGSFSPERLSVYIIKGKRSEVLAKTKTLMQWFTITTLKAAPSQTANPWGGVLLDEVAFTHPNDAFIESIRYAGHHLRDFPEHQRRGEIERALEILTQMATPQLKEAATTDLPPIENMTLEQKDVK
jgi:hypothetical protein